jgi:hypothetical protein
MYDNKNDITIKDAFIIGRILNICLLIKLFEPLTNYMLRMNIIYLYNNINYIINIKKIGITNN